MLPLGAFNIGAVRYAWNKIQGIFPWLRVKDSVTSDLNVTSSADFNLGLSSGDDIPDIESKLLSEGLKQRVSLAAVTYDVEVSVTEVQVNAVANSSIFADDLGEFAAPQNHVESSMVEDAPIPRHVAEDGGVVNFHCIDSATNLRKELLNLAI